MAMIKRSSLYYFNTSPAITSSSPAAGPVSNEAVAAAAPEPANHNRETTQKQQQNREIPQIANPTIFSVAHHGTSVMNIVRQAGLPAAATGHEAAREDG